MAENALIAVIGDEDTVTGFLLAGVGNMDLRKKTNFLVVNDKTPTKDVEDAFRNFTTREDIAVLLINQHCAELIRHHLDTYRKPIPAVLEIPSKDTPYDPSKDSILAKVKGLVGAD